MNNLIFFYVLQTASQLSVLYALFTLRLCLEIKIWKTVSTTMARS